MPRFAFFRRQAKTPSKSAKSSSKKKGGEGTKRRKKRVETFSSYIYKVLKQVHPEIGVSKKAMAVLNSFVNGRSYLFFITQRAPSGCAATRRGHAVRIVSQLSRPEARH